MESLKSKPRKKHIHTQQISSCTNTYRCIIKSFLHQSYVVLQDQPLCESNLFTVFWPRFPKVRFRVLEITGVYLSPWWNSKSKFMNEWRFILAMNLNFQTCFVRNFIWITDLIKNGRQILPIRIFPTASKSKFAE